MKHTAETSDSYPISPDVLSEARGLIVFWTIIVYMGAGVGQSLAELLPVPTLLFTVVIAVHTLLHWYSGIFAGMNSWSYFIIQGLLVSVSAFLLPDGYPIVFIGLFPVLMAQSFGIYHHKSKLCLVFAFYLALFFTTTVLLSGMHVFVSTLPMYILMSLVAIAIANLTLRQFHARMRMQVFLRELEQAHRKVEELTVANERQRIARDLHDTLAQGLAGLIMQLDAVDAHLTKDNPKRAHEIVRQSMTRARKALSEARNAIDDLRSLSSTSIDLSEALREEAKRFGQATGIDLSAKVDIPGDVSKLLVEHGRHIVREALTNIARHAEAKQARLTAVLRDRRLLLEIVDDGKGFDTDTVGKRNGHYGLIGIQERVRILGGTCAIESGAQGTSVRIELPDGKEESV